jgi:hypothetical protein
LTHHEELWVDESESIDDDLALDGLDGIDDDGNSTRVELLERLLRIDIDGRQPAAETGMRVVPADNGFGSEEAISIAVSCPEFVTLPAGLSQHVHHLRLENGVHSLNADTSSTLRHSKDIHDLHSEVIDELAQHQAHDFHRHACAAVAEHLQQCER